MLLQQGRTDDAIAILEAEYVNAGYDGAAMSTGSRLALAYVAAGRVDDTMRVLAEIRERKGGTYHDRLVAHWAEACARFRSGAGDARAPVEAAHAIATGTDAPLEHAIGAHVRALVLEAMRTDDAATVRADADRQLAELGINADGWSRLFRVALARDGV
jgi:hypothetical protein